MARAPLRRGRHTYSTVHYRTLAPSKHPPIWQNRDSIHEMTGPLTRLESMSVVVGGCRSRAALPAVRRLGLRLRTAGVVGVSIATSRLASPLYVTSSLPPP